MDSSLLLVYEAAFLFLLSASVVVVSLVELWLPAGDFDSFELDFATAVPALAGSVVDVVRGRFC